MSKFEITPKDIDAMSQRDLPFMGEGFLPATERSRSEKFERVALHTRLLSFGCIFLDRAVRGILPSDLILLGAPSGVGKTEFCVKCALANMEKGKRVHMIALEAEHSEIERRLKYSLFARFFFADPMRPKLTRPLNYQDWMLGMFEDDLECYEPYVDKLMDRHENLFTFYKHAKFGIDELVDNIYSIASETDLIIVDHIHYFDFEDDNENRALKNIAKTVRDVCQNIKKPIILVAHLRKRDRRLPELVPGIDEFHGSSDLTKIATKVITLGRGEKLSNTQFETYIRVPKNRLDGSVCWYVGRLVFNTTKNAYEDRFEIGRLVDNGREFQAIEDESMMPFWVKG